MRVKRHEVYLTIMDKIDVALEFERRELVGFVLNYRALIEDEWREIYRVDTAHGQLHEQRYWLTTKPMPLKYEGMPLNILVPMFMEQIKENYENYRTYYIKTLR